MSVRLLHGDGGAGNELAGGAVEIVAVIAGHRPFLPGETVYLSCDPEDVLAFPA